MRIAVVGGGVSGLGATWALNEHAGKHEVHLFEAGEYVGGHTNTVEFRRPGDDGAKPVMVDTGFIVFNEVTYPNFLNFIKHLGIEIIASDMSFAVSRTSPLPQPRTLPASLAQTFPTLARKTAASEAKVNGESKQGTSSSHAERTIKERGAFEWAGNSVGGLFSQASNLVSPSHWRMVWDVIRFNHQSVDSLREYDCASEVVRAQMPFSQQSIGSWLTERGYSRAFTRNYLVPMAACIWSTPADDTFDRFPALTLLRFMHNHHLLQIINQPQWLTLKGGSKTYVTRVLSKMPDGQVHLGKQKGRVVNARHSGDEQTWQWTLTTADGKEHQFDRVIFAAHADTTSDLLKEELTSSTSGKEGQELKDALDAFEWNKNTATLHADEELMPVRRKAWSSWNFLAETDESTLTDKPGVTLTYWMNLLQSLPEQEYGPILVTLNAPPGSLRPEKTLTKYAYQHPIYTERSVAAQRTLKTALPNGYKGAHFAGAWTNYGFHEDGFASGLRAAHKLGATPPFEIGDAERTIKRGPLHLERATGAVVELAERFVRRPLSPVLISYILAPVVLLLAFVAEILADAAMYVALGGSASVRSTRCGIRNSLRAVRVEWEQNLPVVVEDALGARGKLHANKKSS